MTTLVLAAGRSRRFGWANKLLAPVGGRPLVAVTVSRVLAATRGPVVVIVDHQARAVRIGLIRAGVVSNRLRVVYARGTRHDMARSRAQGMAAAPNLSSALQIHLADVPWIEARTVHLLRRAIHGGARAARPMHGGQPGHPVRLSMERLTVSRASDPGPLQQILRELPASDWRTISGPPGCAEDIDRRQRLRRFQGE
ncbi:MAG: NTP transferase domain-containing protein [Salinisphaera sp.]|uniref:nucleotidyltransferase family protein n=1 Tax=Salinisphaera sp. TaxID=1914330 RepID=UPI003C7B300E